MTQGTVDVPPALDKIVADGTANATNALLPGSSASMDPRLLSRNRRRLGFGAISRILLNLAAFCLFEAITSIKGKRFDSQTVSQLRSDTAFFEATRFLLSAPLVMLFSGSVVGLCLVFIAMRFYPERLPTIWCQGAATAAVGLVPLAACIIFAFGYTAYISRIDLYHTSYLWITPYFVVLAILLSAVLEAAIGLRDGVSAPGIHFPTIALAVCILCIASLHPIVWKITGPEGEPLGIAVVFFSVALLPLLAISAAYVAQNLKHSRSFQSLDETEADAQEDGTVLHGVLISLFFFLFLLLCALAVYALLFHVLGVKLPRILSDAEGLDDISSKVFSSNISTTPNHQQTS